VVVSESKRGPDESDIIDTLRGRLANFKLPKRVIFAADLPRNAMGKVRKDELRRRHAKALDA
ncbi:MAG: malonyl-CoA synthase, partial [Gammaproteobacteria bacterium]